MKYIFLLFVLAGILLSAGCGNDDQAATEAPAQEEQKQVQQTEPNTDEKQAGMPAKSPVYGSSKESIELRRQAWEKTAKRMEAEANAPKKPQIVIIKSETAESTESAPETEANADASSESAPETEASADASSSDKE